MTETRWNEKRSMISRQSRTGDGMSNDPDVPSRSRAFSVEGCRVLIVEDNPVNRELARAMLQAMGIHADVASDGHEAVEMLGVRDYDLVFMDCLMPVMDGFHAARAIRESERLAGKKPSIIIALTGIEAERGLPRCMEAGMNDCLSKPFSFQDMREMLEKWLSPKRSEGDRREAGFESPAEAG